MSNYYQNKRTSSIYKTVYTTPDTPGLPQTEKFVVLECVTNDKLIKVSDQEFVTLPTKLLNRYFTLVEDQYVDFPPRDED